MNKVNITNANYQNDYKIFLDFDDGISGVLDLKKFLFKKIVAFLKNSRIKNNLKVLTFKAIVWLGVKI
ncbi:MAG: flagellar assembly factor FliW [Rickettsiales bacterium]|jgi:hypothetical protein